jgi:RNA polymerase-binding transcription factor DksA
VEGATVNARQLERFRSQLDELFQQTQADVTRLAEDIHAPSGGQADGEISNAPIHLADRGSEEFQYDLNTVLLENESSLSSAIADARRRIDDGTFGVCEQCGGDIPVDRLTAIPYTRYCVACAATAPADRPAVNVNVGRPAGPDDTLAPEGEMGERRKRRPDHEPQFDPSLADATSERAEDSHAAGTAGGGTSVGGLAGSNAGHGDPNIADIQEATGSGDFDATEGRKLKSRALSGHAGGAVGGTPAGKRAK